MLGELSVLVIGETALGQCLVDSNYFERQDSEAEIITSKSQQNVYYNNVFKHCQGTLNFRHGDNQVAIANNFCCYRYQA